jgi:Domain of unknown function (DUF4180)
VPQPSELTLIEEAGAAAMEGRPGEPLLARVDDANRIVEACFGTGVSAALLYAENLTGAFFDLSSGEAGAILQKLRNYHIRLAVVRSPGSGGVSTKFHEMVAEERRHPFFGLFETRGAALEWLAES